MYGSTSISDAPGRWVRSPGKREQKLLDDVQKLIDSSDEKLISHLREQIDLLLDLASRRQEDKQGVVGIIGSPTVNVTDYELNSEDQ